MKWQLSPQLIDLLKKANVRLRNSFSESIARFEKNPADPHLRNHILKGAYDGYHSIDVTNDYRAIYEEVSSGDETIAYFFLLGTHKELYG
jgi:mRNA-degrading endonuclease YafQ of YafQ-DinJ toxin-antitoxin module